MKQMTKDEAIYKLKVFRDEGKVLLIPNLIYKDKLWDDMCKAFDMAIEALRKQARLEELMNMGTEYADRMYKEGNADDK